MLLHGPAVEEEMIEYEDEEDKARCNLTDVCAAVDSPYRKEETNRAGNTALFAVVSSLVLNKVGD